MIHIEYANPVEMPGRPVRFSREYGKDRKNDVIIVNINRLPVRIPIREFQEILIDLGIGNYDSRGGWK